MNDCLDNVILKQFKVGLTYYNMREGSVVSFKYDNNKLSLLVSNLVIYFGNLLLRFKWWNKNDTYEWNLNLEGWFLRNISVWIKEKTKKTVFPSGETLLWLFGFHANKSKPCFGTFLIMVWEKNKYQGFFCFTVFKINF